MPFPSYRKILSLVQNGQVREAKRGMMVSLNIMRPWSNYDCEEMSRHSITFFDDSLHLFMS